MRLTYKDPKKKKLQMMEIILMVLLLPPGLYYGYNSYMDWTNFRKAELLYTEASALVYQEKLEEAVSKLEEAVAVYPRYYAPWEELGTTHHFMGNHELEVAAYERAVAALPESGNLHRELANAYHEVGQHDKELELAQKATTLPNTDPLFANRILIRAQKEAKGEVDIEKIEQKPEQPHDHGDGVEHTHKHKNEGEHHDTL